MKPARILMVVNAEWYFWSHRLAIARALRDRGHEVVVVAGVERDRQADIEAEGFRFIALRMVRGRLAPASEVITGLDLIRIYRAERPDLAYHTTIKPILYGSLAARLTGIRRVVNAIPGLGYTFASGMGWPAVRRSMISTAYRAALAGRRTRVIFQNVDDLGLFVDRQLVSLDRAVVIRGSGVNLDEFRPSPEPEPDGAPIVLLASRLIWDKGVGELVEAARRLRDLQVRCRIVIVGIPDRVSPNTIPESTLMQWQQEGLIEWWGLRSDMPDVLRRSAIVTLPSYYREGVPKILLEAAASARPVVTTDWPGCRETVRHEETGLMIEPRSVDRLVSALARLLKDRALRAALGAGGRQLAEREFGERLVAERTVAVCENLLAEP